MARSKPFRAVQIDMAICRKLAAEMQESLYKGSFVSYVETVLSKVADGRLVDRKEVESDIREEIYAELAKEGIIVPRYSKRDEREADERSRKAI